MNVCASRRFRAPISLFGSFVLAVSAVATAVVGGAGVAVVHAALPVFSFATDAPDGRMAMVTGGANSESEAADDFVLTSTTSLTSATFTGLVPASPGTNGVQNVTIEFYRVFPLDSTNPPSGNVPTRVNSPSDVEFTDAGTVDGTATFTVAALNNSFTALNSVAKGGIHKIPNQTTGGNGPVTGVEAKFTVTFASPVVLPADHYFFVPQVQLSSGSFLWLSAAKPIVGGTPFTPDLQAWIRDTGLEPDWLRVGTDIVGGATPPTFNAAFTLTGVIGADYVALTPARLADTRIGFHTVDGLFAGDGQRAAGSTLVLTVAGRGGVAADAKAVALNVTAVTPTGPGFATVFPCGSPQPLASNLNFTKDSVVPNAVISGIGTGGSVCIFVLAATDLVVDVDGFFPTTTAYVPMNPARVLETRPGLTTIDGQQQGGGKVAAGAVTVVKIRGRAGVPANATSAVLNVTITGPDADLFATVFPCGTTQPLASSLNASIGATIANLVISKIGSDGTVCIFTQSGTHLVVDVDGYFPGISQFTGLVPARLLDTRPGQTTVDGQGVGAGIRPAGTITAVQITGRGGVPANATSVILNTTADAAAIAGYLTVYPCGITAPLASNVNFVANTAVANTVIAKIGANGTVCVLNNQPTQIIIDVDGYFTG